MKSIVIEKPNTLIIAERPVPEPSAGAERPGTEGASGQSAAMKSSARMSFPPHQGPAVRVNRRV